MLNQTAGVQIDLHSAEVDTYLFLLHGDVVLAYNDNYSLHPTQGILSDSRISMTLGAGTYTVEATTSRGEETGDFSLDVLLMSYEIPELGGNFPEPIQAFRLSQHRPYPDRHDPIPKQYWRSSLGVRSQGLHIPRRGRPGH